MRRLLAVLAVFACLSVFSVLRVEADSTTVVAEPSAPMCVVGCEPLVIHADLQVPLDREVLVAQADVPKPAEGEQPIAGGPPGLNADAGAPAVAPTPPGGAGAPQLPVLKDDPGNIVGDIIGAASAGKWLAAVGGALALVVLALRKWRNKIPWFMGDRGGVVFTILSGSITVVAAGLIAGVNPSWTWILASLALAVNAAGGYVLVKKFFWPSDSKP